MAGPPRRRHSDLTETIVESLMGPVTTGIRARIYQNAIERANTPSVSVRSHLASPGRPLSADTLWIVDRILEPQTIVHFLSFMGSGLLPGGGQTTLPLLGDDVILITKPFSEWATSPFNSATGAVIDDLMVRIGSHEDNYRLQCISEELHAMKSRVWEGIMPLSNRRWEEKRLGEPENFSAACQLITSVLYVFHYLNEPAVRAALRETYNLIWDHLRTFENALNAKRLLESRGIVHVTALWAEYMRAQYAFMENRTHAWLMERLTVMKNRVLKDKREHQPSSDAQGQHDEVQWKLMDMWQDLIENCAHADFALFIPMDGYKGCKSASATGLNVSENAAYSGTTPLSFSPDINKRRKDYHLRRRHVNMLDEISNAMGRLGLPLPAMNDPEALADLSARQAGAQDKTRLELRGEPATLGEESWVAEVSEHTPWGYVAYRGHHGQLETDWAEFSARFNADISNWGHELTEVETIRSRSNIHWLDARELGLDGEDTEALKRHFHAFQQSDDFPPKFCQGLFLVADEASIRSYLNPVPEPTLDFFRPGDLGGFVLAVDPAFDPNEQNDRADESPGFDGTLRVLGSLLWDDLGALMVMQTQYLEDLWPLAMNHPLGVYVGPVVKAQLMAWKWVQVTGRVFLTAFANSQEEQGTAGVDLS